MTDEVRRYTNRLVFELRLRDVPGEVIGDAVAQVESHVADTGESPESAFGRPRDYARSWAAPRHPVRRWPLYLANGALGFGFGCLLILGILGAARNEEVAWGLSPVIAIVVGALGLIAYAVLVVVIAAGRITDPRKGL
ncbi:hypothetical protein [Compostimonas suwonensis]|uniref:Uncharacterized protein n=1 Tax=Compostimonas suwonensis TaxID=1048394 RepID=A0A2M9BBV9_9MICO|nr:hypothetical protein [Compostimonas suwonensis]PJJ55427.1 hypothetical protein CLV54_2770 [Compostimonas suwonensis]